MYVWYQQAVDMVDMFIGQSPSISFIVTAVAGSCVWHLSIILAIVSLPGLSQLRPIGPDSEKILIQPVFLSTKNTMVGKVIE